MCKANTLPKFRIEETPLRSGAPYYTLTPTWVIACYLIELNQLYRNIAWVFVEHPLRRNLAINSSIIFCCSKIKIKNKLSPERLLPLLFTHSKYSFFYIHLTYCNQMPSTFMFNNNLPQFLIGTS